MSDRQPADLSDPRERFLRGFATTVGLERQLLAEPGTTIAALDDRAGTGVLTCYWADQHAIIWADPAVVDDRVAALASERRTVEPATIGEVATAAGLIHRADADMRVLGGKPAASPPVPAPYRQRWLSSADPDHLALVRQFADRSDPVDVEEAALDDLDNFDEAAINVLTVGDDPELVAYASACDWDWDVAFADIGVLVDPGHRGRGLGRLVVAHTTRRLIEQGRIPLYRHGRHNEGSKRIAAGIGFEPATTLAFYSLPD